MKAAVETGAGRARRVVEQRDDLLLAMLGASLAVPYLLMGPGFVMDDWHHLRNWRFDGWPQTAEYLRESRPGAFAVFAMTFGLIGDRPAVIYVVQTVLVIASAIAFRHLLCRFLPQRSALAAACIWLLLPIHSSIDHWAATLNVVVAVLLLLLGLGWLADAARGAPRWGHAGVALIAGTVCYEAVITIALLGTAIAWYHVKNRVPPLMIAAWIVAAGAWMYGSTAKNVRSAAFDFSLLPGGHFGHAAFGPLVVIAVPAVMVGGVVALRRRSTDAAMIIVGFVVIIVGAIVFARFSILELIGIGDRVNAVTSFGTAMVLAGTFVSLSGRRLGLAIVIAAALMVPTRLERSQDYAWAGKRAVALLEASDSTTTDFVNLGECPTYRSYITPFQSAWDATPALQYHHDNPTVSGGYKYDVPAGKWSSGDPCSVHPARR